MNATPETTPTTTSIDPRPRAQRKSKPMTQSDAPNAGKKAEQKLRAQDEAKAAAKPASNKIPLKRICADLGIEPRAARRKLRAAELGFHTGRDRWEFTEKQAERIRAILAPAPEAKE